MDRLKLVFSAFIFSMAMLLVVALVYSSYEVYIQNINFKYEINQMGSLLAHLTTELSNKEALVLDLETYINETCPQ